MTRPLQPWRRLKFQPLLLGLLVSVCLFLPIGYQPIWANDNPAATFPVIRPNIPVYQQGDIVYADVTGRWKLSFDTA